MDGLRRLLVGPRTLLAAFVSVGLLAGILLIGTSDPGARRPAGADGEDASPIAASRDRSDPADDGDRAGAGSPSKRFDLRMDIPQAPSREPEWKQTQKRLTSAPWQFDDDEKTPKVVYLTFDDGPYPTYTEQILALLDRYDARATFFQLGSVQQEFPNLVEKVRAGGHAIGNHSRTHSSLPSMSESAIRRELNTDVDSGCFRPPYGAIDGTVKRLLKEYDMRTVLWDVDTMDWKQPAPNVIEKNVMENVYPGAIVLMHDGGGEREQTVRALARILPELQEKGYEFHALPC